MLIYYFSTSTFEIRKCDLGPFYTLDQTKLENVQRAATRLAHLLNTFLITKDFGNLDCQHSGIDVSVVI